MNKLSEIPNRIKQPSSCCTYCGRGYKTRTGLDKHLILCEVIYKTTKNKNKGNKCIEEEELPTQRRMYQIILELSQKCSKLEQQLEEINKWVVKKKKKINVLEWLNGNITPTIQFDKLIDVITVTEEDIKYLLHNPFIDTLNEIFSRCIFQNETLHPIYAFVQKPNVFYIYETNQQEYIWKEISREILIKFLNLVHRKISRALSEWKKINNDIIKSCDSTSMLYDKTMVKLMSVEFKQESTLSKVRTMMYSKIKTDMKSLIEYEFEC